MTFGSQLAGLDRRVARAMKRIVLYTSVGCLAGCLLTGCSTSRQQLSTFRAAGSHADNRAVLNLISDQGLEKTCVDGEWVSAQLVEMLPGRHQIETRIDASRMQSLSWSGSKMTANEKPDYVGFIGDFVAENGRQYYLFWDQVSSYKYNSVEYGLKGASILEFPVNYKVSWWSQFTTFYIAKDRKREPNYELLSKFKTVAILRPTAGRSSVQGTVIRSRQ
jgi:hypothetical protein